MVRDSDIDDCDDINEWQHVQYPFPEESPSAVHRSSGESNSFGFGIEDTYVVHGRRSDSVPPANPEEDDQSSSPPSSPASASSSGVGDGVGNSIPSPSQSEWRLRVANEGWKILKVRFEAIRDGVVRVASKVRDYAVCVGAFWSITYVTGVALAAAALLVYVGIRRRRRTLHRQGLDHMARLLREKDEKNPSPPSPAANSDLRHRRHRQKLVIVSHGRSKLVIVIVANVKRSKLVIDAIKSKPPTEHLSLTTVALVVNTLRSKTSDASSRRIAVDEVRGRG